ncbi:MAG TPA: hypothetical protein VLA19_19120 [Herpetosiphonaceae bacterium]|nr:hypothetical protein [Herpetosiphonaceae bacterium]
MTGELPLGLPNPARFTLSTYVVAGQVYQSKQDEAGRWYWVAIHPPPLAEIPPKLL